MGVLVMVILFFMYNPFMEAFEYDREEQYCEISYCSKTTLDEFDKCIDLGRESTGFLISEHLFFCCGLKINSKCFGFGNEELEKDNLLGGFGRGMVCQERGND